jgi:hypothetical protein
MPKGPQGQKRPGDVIGAEVSDAPIDDGKDPAAKALGAKGGVARAIAMTPERRAEIAKRAASKRWSKPSC